jgi:hypothetical protein
VTTIERDLARLVGTLAPVLKRRPTTPKRYSKEQRRDLKFAHQWNADRNIVGFGTGPKWTKGKTDYARQSLIVFVVRKLAKSRLSPAQWIPRRVHAESVERDVATDIVEVGTLPMLQATAVLRPGTDAAHFSMRNGSITAVVASRVSPRLPFLLSCCHVLSPPGAIGRQVESPPDLSAITFQNHVADVAAFEPLRGGGNLPNRMDAALARPLASGPGMSNDILGLGRIASTSRLVSGQFLSHGVRQVLGVGAMTPRVRGDILAENVATVLVDPFGRVFLFQDLVAYRPIPATQAGDSGMPILVNTAAGLQLVGMHIGFGRIGNTNVGAAFFVPIAPVLDRLNVDLVA